MIVRVMNNILLLIFLLISACTSKGENPVLDEGTDMALAFRNSLVEMNIPLFDKDNEEMSADEVGAFRKYRHALLLNLAIGNKGGEPVNVKFPFMDYVRIYKYQ